MMKILKRIDCVEKSATAIIPADESINVFSKYNIVAVSQI